MSRRRCFAQMNEDQRDAIRRLVQMHLEPEILAYRCPVPEEYHEVGTTYMVKTMNVVDLPDSLGPWLPYECRCHDCQDSPNKLIMFKNLVMTNPDQVMHNGFDMREQLITYVDNHYPGRTTSYATHFTCEFGWYYVVWDPAQV